MIRSTVEPMLKVRIYTARDDLDRTVEILHKAGVIHIKECSLPLEAAERFVKDKIKELSRRLAKIDELLSRLPDAPVDVNAVISKSKTIKDPIAIYDAIISKAKDYAKELDEAKRKLEEARRELERVKFLEPLRDVNIKFEEFEKWKYLALKIVRMPAREADLILKDLQSRGVIIVKSGYVEDYAVALLGGERKSLQEAVRSLGLEELPVHGLTGTPRDMLRSAEERYKKAEETLRAVYRKISEKARELREELLALKLKLMVAFDRLNCIAKAGTTRFIAVIEGWIPRKHVEKFQSALSSSGSAVHVEFSEPGDGEEPPTLLKNRKLAKPFELLTKLYSLPKYGEPDPTPVIAVSFAIFYGIMVGDAAYGAIIAALGCLLPKLFGRSEAVIKLRDVLLISGFAAIVWGVLTGTYFGNALEYLRIPPYSSIVAVFSDITLMPVVAIAMAAIIGVVHMILAHSIAAVDALRSGDKLVFLNELGIVLTAAAGSVLVANFLASSYVPLSLSIKLALLALVGVGALCIFGVHLISERALGILTGVFDYTGLLGDVLSYTRIAGLLMSSFFLAFAFNKLAELAYGALAGMLPGAAGFIAGLVIALVVAVAGHFINILSTALGSFVHSMRLMFVEFLPKFYAGGGYEYQPFSEEALYEAAMQSLATKV